MMMMLHPFLSQKTLSLPRFIGDKRKNVKLVHNTHLEPFDPDEHADVPEDLIIRDEDGNPTEVRVPMEYRANVYELCMPLITIFVYAHQYILEEKKDLL
jgi:hypothetical protein